MKRRIFMKAALSVAAGVLVLSLNAQVAQTENASLAENGNFEDGVKKWDVDLSPYCLVEYQSEVKPNGRIDHVFTYQREDICLGKGRYRITLKVSGDLFSGLSRGVKIPDEFHRRYEQMFALNKLIAGTAQNLGLFLYVFIICFFGLLFFYQRRGSLRIGFAIRIAQICSCLLGLMLFNRWQLMWNTYPTNVSSFLFGLQKAGLIFFNVTLFSIALGCIFLVVEAMGRYVFPKHLQFAKLWSFGVAGSCSILEQTLIGYAFAIILMAYTTGFYVFSQQWLGWWAGPLGSLIDPNILSMHVPFFTPVVIALQAGFFEEVACRALPIAGILLMTRKSKHKAFWLFVAFFIQMIIFGALHANYPQQPAYCRVVELLFTGSAFGLLYYFFGLLPGIVAHFAYDAFFFAIPIFISSLWMQKICAVLCMFIPLWVVLVHWWLQGKKFVAVPADAYNGAYAFAEPAKKHDEIDRQAGGVISLQARYGAVAFGVVGLLCWYFSNNFQFQSPRVLISRVQAEKIAKETIDQQLGVSFDDRWTVATLLENPAEHEGNKFIWQTYGKDEYQRLLGSYVIPTHYAVKYVNFSASVEMRAEKFEVWITGDGNVFGMRHTVPEFLSGDDISQDKAQVIAYDFVQKIYGYNVDDFEIGLCKSIKHENRRDWVITIKDAKNYGLAHGQGLIKVCLAGSQLAEICRFVQEPESWLRAEQNRLEKDAALQAVLQCLVALWMVLFALIAVCRYGFSISYLKPIFSMVGIFFMFRLFNFANAYKKMLFLFGVSEPFAYQVVTHISSCCINYLIFAGFFAFMIFFILLLGKKSLEKESSNFAQLGLGIALGCGAYGVFEFIKSFAPRYIAKAPQYGFADFTFPAFDILVSYFLLEVLSLYVALAALFIVAQAIEDRYKNRAFLFHSVLFLCAGMALSSCIQLTNVSIWCVSSLVTGLVWYVLYRYFFSRNMALLLISVFVMHVLQLLPSMVYMSYPGIFIQGLISITVFGLMVLVAYRKM